MPMKNIARFAPLIGVLLLLITPPAFTQAQQNEDLKSLRKEIESLKEGQARIEKSLQEIRSLLQSRPGEQPLNVVLNVANEPFLGDKNAKLTMIEFSDYQ
jgi:hypothetical protein